MTNIVEHPEYVDYSHFYGPMMFDEPFDLIQIGPLDV